MKTFNEQGCILLKWLSTIVGVDHGDVATFFYSYQYLNLIFFCLYQFFLLVTTQILWPNQLSILPHHLCSTLTIHVFPWIFTCVFFSMCLFSMPCYLIIPYVYECVQNIFKYLSILNLTPKKIWIFYLINMVFKEVLGFMVLSQVLKGGMSSI